MLNLLHRIEIEIARERVRLALRIFSRDPSEANAHNVDAAKKRWSEIRLLHSLISSSSGLSHGWRTTAVRRTDRYWYNAIMSRPGAKR